MYMKVIIKCGTSLSFYAKSLIYVIKYEQRVNKFNVYVLLEKGEKRREE